MHLWQACRQVIWRQSVFHFQFWQSPGGKPVQSPTFSYNSPFGQNLCEVKFWLNNFQDIPFTSVLEGAKLHMSKNTQIACPQCGHKFNVEDVLSHDIEERLQSQMRDRIQSLESNFRTKENLLQVQQQAMEKERQSLQETIEKKAEKLSLEKEASLRKKILAEQEMTLADLNKELEEKSQKAATAIKLQLELDRLKRDNQLLEQNLRLSIEQELSTHLADKFNSIQQKEAEQAQLLLRQKDELIEDMKAKLSNLKQKMDQGSQERQGEIQELVITDWLLEAFPRDEITDVKKGQKGGDVIHTVKNYKDEVTGKIYYESKRTAKFEHKWISKLKEDNLSVKADILVIITQALPEDSWRVGEIDGVWVCSFHDFKAAALLLREGLVRVHREIIARSNSGDKIKLLYDYLISIEFKQEIENIIDGFNELQDGYLKERQQMEKIWKAREKQLARVLGSANSFIGSIQGIAGSQIPQLKQIAQIPDTEHT